MMLKPLITGIVLSALSLFYSAQSEPAQSESVDYLFLDAYLFAEDLQQSIDVISWDFAHFYLDSTQLAEMLDLAISYDRQTKTLDGWLLSEDNRVLLELNQGKGIIGDKSVSILTPQWRELNGTLYIGTDALKQWFGITANIRTGRLMVNFTTEKEHPRHARIKRQKRYQQIAHRRSRESDWPMTAENWQAITTPNLDINWQQRHQSAQSGSGNQAAVSVQGTMDLLFQESQFSWNQTKGRSKGRFKLSRTLPHSWGNFYYQAGDISALPHPFVSTSQGRGINWLGSKQSQNKLLSRRFEGDAPPGWDVELYRDEVVIAWQAVDDNGQFVFDNIPVSFGDNNFYVVMYGPAGERKQRSYQFAHYDLGITDSRWLPEFSLTQSGKSVFFDSSDNKGWLFNSRLSYGLNKTQALRFGYLQQSAGKATQAKQAVNLELSGFLSRHKYQFNVGRSPDHHGNLYDFAATGKLTDSYDYQLNWRDMTASGPTQAKRTTLGLSANQGLIEHAISLGHQSSPAGQTQSINLSAGKRFEQWSLSNNWSWQKSIEGKNGLGQFNLQWRQMGSSVQLQSNYQWQQHFLWQDLQFSWRYSHNGYNWQWQTKRTIAQSQISHQLNISKTFEHFRLGLSLSDDSQQGQRIALNLTTGINFNQAKTRFTHRNQRSGATVAARAFLDRDFNGHFNPGDQPLPGVKFSGQRHWQHLATDQQGKVRLSGVNSNSLQKVSLDLDSLDDPFLHTPVNKTLLKSHPGGSTELQFPFYITSELEAEVHLWDVEQQVFVPRGGVPLQLQDHDGKVIAQTHSEYDGYFALEKLLPGHYQLNVKPHYLKNKALRLKNPLTFNINQTNAGQLLTLKPLYLIPVDA